MTRPRNAAVSTNDAATFTCATDSMSPDPVPISWSNIPAGATALQTPSIVPLCKVRDDYTPVYHAERGAGVCNLIINSTQLTNAGTYLCQDAGDGTFSTAELVVLGKCSCAFSCADLIVLLQSFICS